jgi:hypothetical protein
MWLGLALIATLFSIWLKVATALSEIVVGTIAQLVIGAAAGAILLAADDSAIKFLSGAGAIVLTFLAGAELDPQVFRRKWKEASAVGLAGFLFPFLGCAAAAHWLLGWLSRPSWLAGVAMSTTSVAVVYAVMLEFGLNRTHLRDDLGFVRAVARHYRSGPVFHPGGGRDRQCGRADTDRQRLLPAASSASRDGGGRGRARANRDSFASAKARLANRGDRRHERRT